MERSITSSDPANEMPSVNTVVSAPPPLPQSSPAGRLQRYNPQDDRWINRAPITEAGGLNLSGFESDIVRINFFNIEERIFLTSKSDNSSESFSALLMEAAKRAAEDLHKQGCPK